MVCKLTDCHSDLSTVISEENTILPITSQRNNNFSIFFKDKGEVYLAIVKWSHLGWDAILRL